MKAKQACDLERKAEEQVVQACTKQRRLDAHAVAIVLSNSTVKALKYEAPWMADLLENLVMKVLAALIVMKGVKPKPFFPWAWASHPSSQSGPRALS